MQAHRRLRGLILFVAASSVPLAASAAWPVVRDHEPGYHSVWPDEQDDSIVVDFHARRVEGHSAHLPAVARPDKWKHPNFWSDELGPGHVKDALAPPSAEGATRAPEPAKDSAHGKGEDKSRRAAPKAPRAPAAGHVHLQPSSPGFQAERAAFARLLPLDRDHVH